MYYTYHPSHRILRHHSRTRKFQFPLWRNTSKHTKPREKNLCINFQLSPHFPLHRVSYIPVNIYATVSATEAQTLCTCFPPLAQQIFERGIVSAPWRSARVYHLTDDSALCSSDLRARRSYCVGRNSFCELHTRLFRWNFVARGLPRDDRVLRWVWETVGG